MADIDRKIRLVMQLRREGIADARVLGAIERVPRERFVDQAFRHQAYENRPLPIKQGQTISQPYVVAYMTEALKLAERSKVLEIGTGSGYQAAVLSLLCRRVYTVERHRTLLLDAQKLFAELKYTNIVTLLGDGSRGWPAQAPFDRIIVTAAAFGDVPADLVAQLAPGGIMILPVGRSGSDQVLVRITRDAAGEVHREDLLPVRFVPLIEGIPRDG
ncbi:MAG: protein-L-isoaspartate(D-aspartate) O-methyltransferase [Pseudomonadota bacterium]|nr:protein-L-isoaspartate(D-aspartate) O-methyltransferase [Pseudomonadota bacterium]